MSRTGALREELERRFYPVVERLGFVVDAADGAAGVDFRRLTPEYADLCDLQWDRSGRPRFLLSFGRCPTAGPLRWFGEDIPREDLLAFMVPEVARLQPRKGTDSRAWFRQDAAVRDDEIPPPPDRPAAEVVDELLAFFLEVEGWFEDGRRGPHVDVIANPLWALSARPAGVVGK